MIRAPDTNLNAAFRRQEPSVARKSQPPADLGFIIKTLETVQNRSRGDIENRHICFPGGQHLPVRRENGLVPSQGALFIRLADCPQIAPLKATPILFPRLRTE